MHTAVADGEVKLLTSGFERTAMVMVLEVAAGVAIHELLTIAQASVLPFTSVFVE